MAVKTYISGDNVMVLTSVLGVYNQGFRKMGRHLSDRGKLLDMSCTLLEATAYFNLDDVVAKIDGDAKAVEAELECWFQLWGSILARDSAAIIEFVLHDKCRKTLSRRAYGRQMYKLRMIAIGVARSVTNPNLDEEMVAKPREENVDVDNVFNNVLNNVSKNIHEENMEENVDVKMSNVDNLLNKVWNNMLVKIRRYDALVSQSFLWPLPSSPATTSTSSATPVVVVPVVVVRPVRRSREATSRVVKGALFRYGRKTMDTGFSGARGEPKK